MFNLYDKFFGRHDGGFDDYEEEEDFVENSRGEEEAEESAAYARPVKNFFERGRQESPRRSRVIDMRSGNSLQSDSEVIVMVPANYDQTRLVCDYIRAGKSVICNIENIRKDTAMRALDFIRGAAYALNGTLEAVNENIFIVTPVTTKLTFSDRENRRPERRPLAPREAGPVNSRRLFTAPPSFRRAAESFEQDVVNR